MECRQVDETERDRWGLHVRQSEGERESERESEGKRQKRQKKNKDDCLGICTLGLTLFRSARGD